MVDWWWWWKLSEGGEYCYNDGAVRLNDWCLAVLGVSVTVCLTDRRTKGQTFANV